MIVDRAMATRVCTGFRVSGFGFRVSGLGFRVSGFGFRVSGFEDTASAMATRVCTGGITVLAVIRVRF
jgi:hypothetical protein